MLPHKFPEVRYSRFQWCLSYDERRLLFVALQGIKESHRTLLLYYKQQEQQDKTKTTTEIVINVLRHSGNRII